jgi:hypothetical protein
VAERENLLAIQNYVCIANNSLSSFGIAKVGTELEKTILNSISKPGSISAHVVAGRHTLYYTRKVRYFLQFLDFVPEILNASGELISPSELKEIRFTDSLQRDAALSVYNSSIFFWFFNVYSDVRNINKREVEGFPIDVSKIDNRTLQNISVKAREIMADLALNSRMLTGNYKDKGTLSIQSFQPRKSKAIIDEIDALLGNVYKLKPEQQDFIINYDIKYRMGLNGEETDADD